MLIPVLIVVGNERLGKECVSGAVIANRVMTQLCNLLVPFRLPPLPRLQSHIGLLAHSSRRSFLRSPHRHHALVLLPQRNRRWMGMWLVGSRPWGRKGQSLSS